MNENLFQHRLSLLKVPVWSFNEIKDLFGVDLNSNGRLLNLFEKQIENTGRNKDQYINQKTGEIKKDSFEVFLQKSELIPLSFAAARWGMDPESLKNTLTKCREQDIIPEKDFNNDFVDVYPHDMIRNLARCFPELKNKAWGSINDEISDLHTKIRSTLDISITEKRCPVSELLKDDQIDYSYEIDSLTYEPIGMVYNLSIHTPGRDIRLAPNVCSYLTYFKFETLFDSNDIFQNPWIDQNKLDQIRKLIQI